MSLQAVADAVEAGHIGGAFVKNKDESLKVAEIATVCKLCKTPWPCSAIAKARTRLMSDAIRK